jgi:hypothetical protein
MRRSGGLANPLQADRKLSPHLAARERTSGVSRLHVFAAKRKRPSLDGRLKQTRPGSEKAIFKGCLTRIEMAKNLSQTEALFLVP